MWSMLNLGRLHSFFFKVSICSWYALVLTTYKFDFLILKAARCKNEMDSTNM